MFVKKLFNYVFYIKYGKKIPRNYFDKLYDKNCFQIKIEKKTLLKLQLY
jgi:hypothetical protein